MNKQNHMQRWVIYISMSILYYCPTHTYATNLDSLKKAVEIMNDDTLKCAALNTISRTLYSGEESRMYAHRALKLAKAIGDSSWIGQSYYRVAWSHEYDMMDAKSMYLDSATNVYSNLGDLSGLAMTYNLKAIMFMDYGLFENSQEYWNRANEMYLELGDGDRQATILNNWGVCLYMAEKPAKAIEKYRSALKFRLTEEPEQPIKLGRVYNGFAICHKMLGDYKLASDYHLKAYLSRSKGTKIAVTETLVNMAELYYEAIEKNVDTTGLLDGFRMIGFDSPMAMLDSAALIDGVSDRPGIQYSILESKRKGHIAYGDFKNAYKLLETQKQIDEEQKLSASSLKAIADIKSLYEQEKLKTQLLDEEFISQKKSNQVNLLILFLSLLIGTLIIGYQLYLNRMRKNQLQLAEAKQEQNIISMRSMLEGQEKERARIARDLHDGLGNLLSTLKGNISSLKIDFTGNKSQQIHANASDMIDEACAEVRKIAHEMMPQALEKLGLVNALQDLVHKADSTHDFNAQIQIYGERQELAEDKNVMIYRIVQELLNNIVKYAEADEVLVQLIYSDDILNLMVEDDGIGFDFEDAKIKGGMGMKSIAFRTNYIGGEFEIDSRENEGTSVSINIPLSVVKTENAT